MASVTMYLTPTCPYCLMARRLLASKGVAVNEIRIDNDPAMRAQMIQRSGRHTVPQIFVGDHHVGGCDDLHALDARGGLAPLLAGAAR